MAGASESKPSEGAGLVVLGDDARLSAPRDLRDMATLLAPEWRHLSPGVGALVAASPFLANVSQRGPEADAVTKLVKELFHQPTHGEAVRLTRNKSKAAYYATVERLCTWLALHAAKKLADKMGAERAALLEPWYRECRCSRRSLDRLVDLVARADAESALYAWPHIGSAIVLAALWMRANSKSELLGGLVTQLSLYAPHTLSAEAHESTRPWLYSAFTEVALDERHEDPWTSAVAWERTAAQLLASRHRYFPTAPRAGDFSVGGAARLRPDCAERCLRALVNLSLFDVETQQLCVERLSEMGACEELQRFYTEHGVAAQQSVEAERRAGAAWFALCASLGDAGVRYLVKSEQGVPYEVAPSKSNLLRVLTSLFAHSRVPVHSWNDVGTLLSSSACRLVTRDEVAAGGRDDGVVQVRAHWPRSGVSVGARISLNLDSHAHFIPNADEAHAPPAILVRTLWQRHVMHPHGHDECLAPLLSLTLSAASTRVYVTELVRDTTQMVQQGVVARLPWRMLVLSAEKLNEDAVKALQAVRHTTKLPGSFYAGASTMTYAMSDADAVTEAEDEVEDEDARALHACLGRL